MRSYVYKTEKLPNGERIVTRYTLEESLCRNILKLLFFLFILWPIELFLWWPLKLIVKGSLIGIKILFRLILWTVKCPFYLLLRKGLPHF